MPKKFGEMTRAARKAYIHSDVDEERFIIDFPTVFLLIAAVVAGTSLAITAFQMDVLNPIYLVAEQLNQLLMVGTVLVLFVAMFPTSKGKPRFDVKIMNREELITGMLGLFIAFSVARIASHMIALTLSELYNIPLAGVGLPSMFVIVFAAAVVEEVVFGLGLSTGLYVIIYKVLDGFTGEEGLSKGLAILIASSLVAVVFANIHIGTYGTSLGIFGFLFVSRFVYSSIYLITRNSHCLWAHILHNLTLGWV